jgi:hypothetical protein
MSIGASILNTELTGLSGSHDTFMAQLRDAWKIIRSFSGEETSSATEEPSIQEAQTNEAAS